MRIEAFLLIAVLLFAAFSIPVYAHDGNHKEKRKQTLAMDWAWKETPVFCLFEPKDTIQKSFVAYYDLAYMIEYATDYWTAAMNWAAPNGNWDVEIKIYQDWEYSPAVFKEHKQCQVFIHFELQDNPDNLIGGFVKVQKSDRIFDEMVIILSYLTYPEHGMNVTKHETKPKELIQDIVIHEVGHAFQLGHYAPSVKLTDGWHYDLQAESVMFGQVDHQYPGERMITDRDVISLLRQYGHDGWGGYTPPFTPWIEFPIP